MTKFNSGENVLHKPFRKYFVVKKTDFYIPPDVVDKPNRGVFFMDYIIFSNSFVKIVETSGTIQNSSQISKIELADSPNFNNSVILYPHESRIFNTQLFARLFDNNDPPVEFRVVPFSNDFIIKKSDAVQNNLTVFDSDGDISDSGISASSVFTTVQGFTENNIIVFDSNGKPKNSGHSVASDAQFTAMLDEVFPTVSAD